MKDSAYKISLDINGSGSQLVLNARHMDTGRKLYVSLRSGSDPYIIEKNCYAAFAATKPDGTDLYNACEIEGNEIVYEFTEQTCSVIGRSRCEIILYGPDDKVITSPRFALLVDGTICPEGKVVSTDEFTALTHATSEAIEATTAANQAADDANQAAKDAQTTEGRADEAAVRADDAAASANQAAQSANTASAAAGKAATAAQNAEQRASDAALEADDAATRANKATEAANSATEAANSAAINANQAATKAAQTAKSLMVVGKAEGANIYLDDAIDQFLVGCRIFGKTTQDGTPTPYAPVELVSVGDSGSITVNVSGKNKAKSMTISTPNGLPGIPVASGGNYTDANGQQWICDEIDFSRGVHIQRVAKKELDGSEVWSQAGSGEYFSIAYSYLGNTTGGKSCCSHFGYDSNGGKNYFVSGTVGFAFFHVLDSVSDWKAFLADQFTNGSPVTLIFPVAKPIETPLSEEELAAYAALHTYRGNTTVSNDSSAHMEIEYVMDAKKYIDSLAATPQARLADITLRASAWAGSNSLYSQVVSIPGITEYSKVDLLPSVEQLAIFFNKNVAFVTENEDGVVTVYAIGDKPTLDYTMQAQITEVEA